MYSLGLDFGTNSVRCVIVNLESGEVIGESVCNYPSGIDGVIVDEKDPHLARQNPSDYHITLEKVVIEAISKGKEEKGFSPEKVIGIGVDTTGSTPIPVDENMVPLSFHDEFKNNPNAMAWLWKDHTSSDEAEQITELARKIRPQYLSKIGGVYSSEWFFSKILHLSRIDKKVYKASASFVELCDYIPAILTGKRNPKSVFRSLCAAGHKAMYSQEWGGLPDDEFLEELSPEFKNLREKLYEKAYPQGTLAGYLCKKWAEKLSLPEGICVSVGGLDAHIGAVAAGIDVGRLVKVIGTSGCDMMIFPKSEEIPDIPGLCGIVPDSIVPGFTGLEAGQSAVGDIFYWFVKRFMGGKTSHEEYMELARRLKPGQSGLLALDWHNGNRCILVDQKLTGLIVGFTLNTRPEEVYRALVEATGFGARVIIEQMEKYGVKVNDIIACGGIPEKNPFLMQIYADITKREIRISAISQNSAVGAAIFGAISAGKEKGGFGSVREAQEKICKFRDIVYKPIPENSKIYDELFNLYKILHDSFGTKSYSGNLYYVMKKLLQIKNYWK